LNREKSLKLLYSIIIAVILGIAAGWFMGEDALIFSWMGTLWLNALKMVVVPLIIAAIITGISSLGDVRKLGRPGLATLVYFILTTMLAALTGLVLAEILAPGSDFHLIPTETNLNLETRSLSDVLLGLISPNIVASAANLELLQLIIFAVIFGAALTVTGEKGKTVSVFFEGLNNIMMIIVGWIMMLSPFGVFGLVATPIAEAGGGAAILETFAAVGAYMITVLCGLLLFATALFFLSRRGFSYLRDMFPALLTAFSTSSSSATVPLSMDCAQSYGLHKSAVRFVIPLGSTVNMNGTAVYQGVAVIFLSQVYGVDIGLSDYFLVAMTASLAAIGSAGIPQGGHVMTLMLFSIAGIPAEGFGLIIAVDWILDRFRTTLNVWGDLVGAGIIDRFVIDDG
jgi:Na+/H+-dicarboxylate symporter